MVLQILATKGQKYASYIKNLDNDRRVAADHIEISTVAGEDKAFF